MKDIIDSLVNLTLDHEIEWNTIDKLIVNGEPYVHFRHILIDQSYFTKYNDKTFVILYGEALNWIDQSTIRQFFFQQIEDNAITDIDFPIKDIVKLHTIIQIA
ncbi:hypothetical protein E5983_00745 [Streptococcus danieliae]|uniref:Uncharacterized protein n=1 Tax=Streptococcus danieliae TaxID=747656 RepID=A0A7X3G772_9STRE|nr:hypothetical protein [Streptococcus danieliae]MVX58202.1 hypothetical protein [Streptococcus danieliae]